MADMNTHFTPEEVKQWDDVNQAVNIIKKGICKRIDVNKDTKVYACKNVIRIDIKCEGIL